MLKVRNLWDLVQGVIHFAIDVTTNQLLLMQPHGIDCRPPLLLICGE